jgi:hypothetical protein
VVARSGSGGKIVVLGFDPTHETLAQRLVTPLFIANTLRWFVPDLFHSTETRAQAPGWVETDIRVQADADVSIESSENPRLPWSVSQGRLRFFAGRPGVVRVRTPDRQAVYQLRLPGLGRERWDPPAGLLRGVPPPAETRPWSTVEWWPWLALAALACLALEWVLYGRRRFASVAPQTSQGATSRQSSFLDLPAEREETIAR